jgi:exodeoxyribonuclease VII large subunit
MDLFERPNPERDSGTRRDILTVAALNRAVAVNLSRSFPLLRVRGEIANFTRAASGHWYCTLKDDAAQVRCVMFRGRNALVDFAPREGDAVEVLAQVGLYEARGEFQLLLESMTRAGAGPLFEQFLRLKAELAAEGLFDATIKRPLPLLPRTVGVITSLRAAALADVLTAMQRRAPYLRVVVYPVAVQGAGAGAQIAAALQKAGARAEVDVLLLVRGGGSIEDLWAFNEEAVARAIRACPLPVVVGVGHESDFTIADFAADLRAPTPTAAAELVAPAAADLQAAVSAAVARVRRMLERQLQSASQRLDYATRRLAAPSPLRGWAARVAELHARLQRQAAGSVGAAQRRVSQAARELLSLRPSTATAQLRLQVGKAALAAGCRQRLLALQHRCDTARAALTHLDPSAVLARGYAIALNDTGRAVTDAAQLAPGATLRVLLARGAARTRVEALEKPDSSEGH